MPITSSAKKALRGSLRKRERNISRKREMLDVLKKMKKLVADKNKEEAEKLIPKVQKILDKSAKVGIIKKNSASRKKSRISAMVKKIS